MRHYDPEVQVFLVRLRRRDLHYLAAIYAVAARILRRVYAVLRDRTEYSRLVEETLRNREKPGGASVSEVAQQRLKDKAD